MGTSEDYLQLARDAGLATQAIQDLSRRVKRTWPICARRVCAGLLKTPGYRRFLFKGRSPERVFALTLLRIWLAYETGGMT